MATLLTEVNSVLGIEIGSITTRAVLFDVVEENYQFIAAGTASSTWVAPQRDVYQGVVVAIQNLQQITGRFFLDLNQKLIIPSHGGIEGVDKLLVNLSCGPDLKIAIFSLLNDFSTESALHLAHTMPVSILENVTVNDRRSRQQQVDALLAARPDLILFAGGTDGGSTKSVARMAGVIESSLHLLPSHERPTVLFCGNRAMSRRVREIIEGVADVQITANIRPGIESEDLEQASFDLNQVIVRQRSDTLAGLEKLAAISSDKPMLSAVGLHRVVRYLGKQYDPDRRVLSIDLGSSHTTAAWANHDTSRLITLPIGVGFGLENVMKTLRAVDIERWMSESAEERQIMEYLWQKTLFPASLPVTNTDQSIESALARHLLSLTMRDLESHAGLASRSCEPILISGAALTHASTPWRMLLTLLDGIQPVGITPLVVDKHGILSLLGTAARVNPLLPVQVLESTAFVNLATVINVESRARIGTPLFDAILQSPSGNRHEITVNKGEIVSLPLAFGEPGLLNIYPHRKIRIADAEIGREALKIKGGVCGLVFDARGRPLVLPQDPVIRRGTLLTWLTANEQR